MRTQALLLSVVLPLLSSCTHKVSIVMPNVYPAERHKTWVNGWLWDLVGGETNTATFCGDRPVARVQTAKSFGNHLVSWLTFGIYTPMHATITCGAAAQPSVPPQYALPPQQPYAPPPAPPLYESPPQQPYAPPPPR